MRRRLIGMTYGGIGRFRARSAWAGSAAGALVLMGLTVVTGPVQAIEQATGAATVPAGGLSATIPYRPAGAMTATITATRAGYSPYGNPAGANGSPSFELLSTTPHSTYGATSNMFAPGLNTTTTPTIGFQAWTGYCGNGIGVGTGTGVDFTGFCPDVGTVTVAFSKPVTNPIMDVSGLGGWRACTAPVGGPPPAPGSPAATCPVLDQYGVATNTNAAGQRTAGSHTTAQYDIVGSVGTPVTFQPVTGPGIAPTNLSVTPTTLTSLDKDNGAYCTVGHPQDSSSGLGGLSNGNTATAGCGSVILQGTFTSVTFNVSTWIEKFDTAGWANGFNMSGIQKVTSGGVTAGSVTGLADLARISFRLQEDQGDAPSSYDPGQAATHYAGPLKLGAALSFDQLVTANPATPGKPSATANLDQDDALGGVFAPEAVYTQPYSLTVPLSGTESVPAGTEATLAGWIDWNGNTVFDAGERASVTYPPGATEATLTWTLPAGVERDTYLRLRTSYDAAELAAPTGIARSGEVEDYQIHIRLPEPQINVLKTAVDVTGPDSNGDYTARYQVKVENTGEAPGAYGPLEDAPGFSSNFVPTEASWTASTDAGTAPLPGTGMATGPGSYALTAGSTVDAGATHTYDVAIKFHFQDVTVAPDACTGATGNALFNAASVPAEDGPTTDNTACLPPPNPPAPKITVIKRINGQDANEAPGPTVPVGSPMTITFDVENTGNVTLTDVTLEDDVIPGSGITVGPLGWPGAAGTLTPGQQVQFIATYDAPVTGGVLHTNTGTVTGTPPYGAPDVTAQDPAHATTAEDPHIEVVKKINGDDANTLPGVFVLPGSPMHVTFEVTNTGDTVLTDVTLTDDTIAATDITVVDPPGWPTPAQPQRLAPGETVTYEATIPAPAQRGATHTNRAKVTGEPPSGNTTEDEDPANATTIDPKIAVIKRINGQDANEAPGPTIPVGSPMTITFDVENTGNVTLTEVTLDDDVIADADISLGTPGWPGPVGTLAPGEKVQFTATYDAPDTGGVLHTNVGTVAGTPPLDAPDVTASDPANATTAEDPHIEVVKKINGDDANTLPGVFVDPGSPMVVTFEVTNTGDTVLTDVTLSDDKIAASDISVVDPPGWPTPAQPQRLAPGETVTYQATVAAPTTPGATHTNTATVTGEPPSGNTVDDDDPANATTRDPKIEVTKFVNGEDANAAPGVVVAPGAALNFRFVVKNTGNLPLTDVVLTDDKLAGLTPPAGWDGTLAPGEEVEFTGTMTAPATGGVLHTNIATVQGQPPTGEPVEDSDPANATTKADPLIEITKYLNGEDANTAPGVTVAAGGLMTFRFVVKNTGNMPLSGVTLTDDKLATINPPAGWDGTLDPGEQVEFTATMAAPAKGDVLHTNTATVVGQPPAGDPVKDSDPANATTTTEPVPDLSLDKRVPRDGVVDVNGNGLTDAGDTIAYEFELTNTGNVPLTDLAVDDPKLGAVTCPQITLAPGDSVVCTAAAVHIITQAEVKAGVAVNTAIATASDPDPDTTPVESDQDTVETPTEEEEVKGAFGVFPTGADGDEEGSVPDRLPDTGGPAGSLLPGGLGALLLGSVLLLSARRRAHLG